MRTLYNPLKGICEGHIYIYIYLNLKTNMYVYIYIYIYSHVRASHALSVGRGDGTTLERTRWGRGSGSSFLVFGLRIPSFFCCRKRAGWGGGRVPKDGCHTCVFRMLRIGTGAAKFEPSVERTDLLLCSGCWVYRGCRGP